MPQNISIIGFGSQGSAWAQCLRQSGWQVSIYLPDQSKSWKKALELGFEPQTLQQLSRNLSGLPKDGTPTENQDKTHREQGNLGLEAGVGPVWTEGRSANSVPTFQHPSIHAGVNWIAMLCPDPLIGPIYRKWIAHSPAKVRLILAHGFAVYSGDLKTQSPLHQPVLLAPKAIGPKLLQSFQRDFPSPHTLVAAISEPSTPGISDSPHVGASENERQILLEIAAGLGFSKQSLVSTSFEKETIGDLMSEQGLLCGGIFNLLEWTMEAMQKAGVPAALIQEECLTELELVAGLIRERGAAKTFQCISQVAQGGTIAMAERFAKSSLKEQFMEQMEEVRTGEFIKYFRSDEWKGRADQFVQRLSSLEERLKGTK